MGSVFYFIIFVFLDILFFSFFFPCSSPYLPPDLFSRSPADNLERYHLFWPSGSHLWHLALGGPASNRFAATGRRAPVPLRSRWEIENWWFFRLSFFLSNDSLAMHSLFRSSIPTCLFNSSPISCSFLLLPTSSSSLSSRQLALFITMSGSADEVTQSERERERERSSLQRSFTELETSKNKNPIYRKVLSKLGNLAINRTRTTPFLPSRFLNPIYWGRWKKKRKRTPNVQNCTVFHLHPRCTFFLIALTVWPNFEFGFNVDPFSPNSSPPPPSSPMIDEKLSM